MLPFLLRKNICATPIMSPRAAPDLNPYLLSTFRPKVDNIQNVYWPNVYNTKILRNYFYIRLISSFKKFLLIWKWHYKHTFSTIQTHFSFMKCIKKFWYIMALFKNLIKKNPKNFMSLLYDNSWWVDSWSWYDKKKLSFLYLLFSKEKINLKIDYLIKFWILWIVRKLFWVNLIS